MLRRKRDSLEYVVRTIKQRCQIIPVHEVAVPPSEYFPDGQVSHKPEVLSRYELVGQLVQLLAEVHVAHDGKQPK